MTISDWIGIIGIVATIVGIIVGIIGWKSLNKANQIHATSIENSPVTQGENVTIINNGNDTYVIMKIARDITRDELSEVVHKLSSIKEEVNVVKHEVDSFPRFHVGTTPPSGAKNGDIWFRLMNEEEK